MDLDEAIAHCEAVAIQQSGCECGIEHLQLAGWLKELRALSPKYRLADFKWKEPGWYGPDGVRCERRVFALQTWSVFWGGKWFSEEQARICGFWEVE